MSPKVEILTVSEEQTGGRLDQFLASSLPAYSRARIQNLLESGVATVNSKVITRANYRLQTGDTVTFTHLRDNPEYPAAEDISLSILFEDEDIIVIDKAAGMATHPNGFDEHHTVVQALLHHVPNLKNAVYDPENPLSRLRPGVVHRLDKGTSGVLVAAKNHASLLTLAQQFHNRTIKKEYIALLYGSFKGSQTITAPLTRLPGDPNRMAVSNKPEEGRAARTQIIATTNYQYHTENLSLVRCIPETGRTHQIRVHAAHINHPVLGDPLYNTKESRALAAELQITYQLLHASSLTFEHPQSKTSLTFSAPLPERFTDLIARTSSKLESA